MDNLAHGKAPTVNGILIVVCSVLLSVTTGLGAYMAKTVYESGGQTRETQVKIITTLDQTVAVVAKIDARVEKIADQVVEHGKRIAIREGDAFRASDAAKLQAAVTEHSAILARQSDQQSKLVGDVRTLRAAVERVWREVQAEGRP